MPDSLADARSPIGRDGSCLLCDCYMIADDGSRRRQVSLTLSIVSTAHFRLWRYSELSTDFAGTFVTLLVAFIVALAQRAVRLVMALRRDVTFGRANGFWSAPPLGSFYSVRPAFVRSSACSLWPGCSLWLAVVKHAPSATPATTRALRHTCTCARASVRARVQVVCVLNLVFTVLWYVKGISALRRLATSEYHLTAT